MLSDKSSRALKKIKTPFGPLIKAPFGSLIKTHFGSLINATFGSLIKAIFGSLIKAPFGFLTAENLLDCEKLTFLTAEKIIFNV